MNAPVNTRLLNAVKSTSERIKGTGNTSDNKYYRGSDWLSVARPNQLPPDGDWFCWLILAGRGWGKTRTGAEWVKARVAAGARWVALVGATAADVRDVMIEGPAGIMAIWPGANYEPSRRRVTLPNGAVLIAYSAEEPNRLRGPQHDAAWCDELAAWKYPQQTWDMLMFGLRLGADPRVVVTTTPRPIPTLKAIMKDEKTSITRGSTYENISNLAPQYQARIIARYEGTRLGRQELYAELLDDMPGALWQRALLEDTRVTAIPPLARIVVAIDPAATANEGSNETGVIVAGKAADGQVYILDDLSLRASPNEWGRAVIAAYHKYKADRVVYETNQGGDMVASVLKTVDPNVPLTPVTASRSKQTRAEPVAALYEQGKVHHVGMFGALEDQLCSWVPGETSPDRLDALVWAVTELALQSSGKAWFA